MKLPGLCRHQEGPESGTSEIPIQDTSLLDNKIFLENLTAGLEDKGWELLNESRVISQGGTYEE